MVIPAISVRKGAQFQGWGVLGYVPWDLQVTEPLPLGNVASGTGATDFVVDFELDVA